MAKQVFCCALLLISILTFAATAYAVEVKNQLSTEITVYAPPLCRPCPCQGRRDCVCTAQCIENGKAVAAGSSATVASDEEYPLAYLTVERVGSAYNVKAADLKRITVKTTLVVTSQTCEVGGLVAQLLDRSSKQDELICLVPGDRYGS